MFPRWNQLGLRARLGIGLAHQAADVAISNAHAEQIELDDSVVLRNLSVILSMAPWWAPAVGV
jgi:hypothetical protein